MNIYVRADSWYWQHSERFFLNMFSSKVSKPGFLGWLLAFFLVVPSFSFSPVWAEDSSKIYSNNPVVAVVDGEPIKLDQLKNAKIQEEMVRLFELQKRILKQKILKKLEKSHPEMARIKMPQASRKDVIQFYNQTPGVKELGPIEKTQDEIRQYLNEMYKDSFYETQYQTAVDKGWVVDYFEAPNEFQLVASLGKANLWFKENSKQPRKVYVLEFSDFQCPFCKRVQATLSKLRERYQSRVQFGYRHFPLPFHKEAQMLAEASECARDQGKFWELQSLLYKLTLTTIQMEQITNLAKNAGVRNIGKFEKCVQSRRYMARVNKDLQDGVALGIQGTPTFIIGMLQPDSKSVRGEMFSGAVSEEMFVDKIEKYLNKLKNGKQVSALAANP